VVHDQQRIPLINQVDPTPVHQLPPGVDGRLEFLEAGAIGQQRLIRIAHTGAMAEGMAGIVGLTAGHLLRHGSQQAPPLLGGVAVDLVIDVSVWRHCENSGVKDSLCPVGSGLADPSQPVLLPQTSELRCHCDLHAHILPIKGKVNQDLLGAYRPTPVAIHDAERGATSVDTLVSRRPKIHHPSAVFSTLRHPGSIS